MSGCPRCGTKPRWHGLQPACGPREMECERLSHAPCTPSPNGWSHQWSRCRGRRKRYWRNSPDQSATSSLSERLYWGAAMTQTSGIPTQLGHIALRVRDLNRAVEFYRDVVGLKLHSRHGDAVAFLGIRPDASHEVALFALASDAPGPESNRVGMYHMAWEMPSFPDLQAFHTRLLASDTHI